MWWTWTIAGSDPHAAIMEHPSIHIHKVVGSSGPLSMFSLVSLSCIPNFYVNSVGAVAKISSESTFGTSSVNAFA